MALVQKRLDRRPVEVSIKIRQGFPLWFGGSSGLDLTHLTLKSPFGPGQTLRGERARNYRLILNFTSDGLYCASFGATMDHSLQPAAAPNYDSSPTHRSRGPIRDSPSLVKRWEVQNSADRRADITQGLRSYIHPKRSRETPHAKTKTAPTDMNTK
jgi:hypothetical protein